MRTDRVGRLALFAVVGLAGCGRLSPAPVAAGEQPAGPAARHDPDRTGTVRGRVTWAGDVPRVPPELTVLPDGAGGYRSGEMPNPFAPAVDPATRGLAGAVVSLAGVDPAADRPWDLPPVRVEMAGYRIHVRQGDGEPRRVGIVRRGDEVEMASAEPVHHMLRARGAAFFTLPFPSPNRPLRRRLDTAGLVGLTSGAGYPWAAADLFVTDHPYFAVTDQEGRFELPGVPAGRYELVCWVRDWHVAGKDRDPETGLVFRQRWAPPVNKSAAVAVDIGQHVEQGFSIGASSFVRGSSR